jgi:hypothetical protein
MSLLSDEEDEVQWESDEGEEAHQDKEEEAHQHQDEELGRGAGALTNVYL